jgi:hypothetical protein
MNRKDDWNYVKAFSNGFHGLPVSRESNGDLFAELARVINVDNLHEIVLYPLDFVQYVLESYGLAKTKVYQAIENAKRAQLHGSDLTRWFQADNEVGNEHSLDGD